MNSAPLSSIIEKNFIFASECIELWTKKTCALQIRILLKLLLQQIGSYVVIGYERKQRKSVFVRLKIIFKKGWVSKIRLQHKLRLHIFHEVDNRIYYTDNPSQNTTFPSITWLFQTIHFLRLKILAIADLNLFMALFQSSIWRNIWVRKNSKLKNYNGIEYPLSPACVHCCLQFKCICILHLTTSFCNSRLRSSWFHMGVGKF